MALLGDGGRIPGPPILGYGGNIPGRVLLGYGVGGIPGGAVLEMEGASQVRPSWGGGRGAVQEYPSQGRPGGGGRPWVWPDQRWL